MKMTRRIFAFSLLITSFIFSVAGGSAGMPAANHKYLVFVGTYTTKTESKGIYAYEFDSDAGKLAPKGVATETRDPSWVVVHPSGKFLYAANEAGKASTVSAFAIEAKSGKLTLVSQLPALGEDPCYLSFDRTGKYVFVANYTSGNVVVFPVNADGKLGAATANVRDEGKLGPNKERQDGPHAHWIETPNGNGMVFVADLGLDQVLIYPFEPKTGSLASDKVATSTRSSTASPGWSVTLSPGTGPRHVAFSRGRLFYGRFLYVLGELRSSVTVFKSPGSDVDNFHSIQQISTLPKGFSGRNDAAEIAIHPNGKNLYASNRGHDSIAVFAIDPKNGRLKPVSDVPTGGKEPRHFAIDPSGKYLLAENQFSNNIVVFKIDAATGGLTPTGQVVEVPSPVNIAFLQED
jgi:6-phosphogluconolactonase